ncbi:hypothetical protein P9112_008387 [Eukaryota sp. TZLM1-RC]
MLKWVMVKGRIETTRLLQPAVSSQHVPAQIEDIQKSPQPQQSEVPAPSVQPTESVQPSMKTDPLSPIETSDQTAMERPDNEVVTVKNESPTPTTSSDEVPAPITPVSQKPPTRFTPFTIGSTFTLSSRQSFFSGIYESSPLLSSMIGFREA